MNAQDIITALQANTYWIKQAALFFRPNKHNRAYDTTTALFFNEVTVRIPTTKISKRTRQPYQSLQRRRIDLVALIKPNYRAYDLLVVGVEIKVNKHDLINDTKMDQYAPYCHMSYIACPYDLMTPAFEKIEDIAYTTAGDFGLMLFDDEKTLSHIQHPPIYQPSDQHLKEMYSELLNKQFKSNSKEKAS